MASETVVVQILDKDYQVSCPPEERNALLQSAQLLDERMRTIRRGGAVIGLERIAVMAALNLSHELLRRSEEHTSELQSRGHLVCRLLLEKKKKQKDTTSRDCTATESLHTEEIRRTHV